MLIWFLPLFLLFLMIGLPVFFGLLAAPGILLWLNDLLVGVSLMVTIKFMAKRYNFPAVTKKTTWSQRGKASLKAFFPLMTPVIILGGILGGIFTPTEASAVAAAYAMFIGLFVLKSLEWKEIPKVMTKAAMVSSVVLLLVGAAMAFKTVVSLSHAPEYLAQFVLGLSDNPYILLFLINK